mgnify:FL=1
MIKNVQEKISILLVELKPESGAENQISLQNFEPQDAFKSFCNTQEWIPCEILHRYRYLGGSQGDQILIGTCETPFFK